MNKRLGLLGMTLLLLFAPPVHAALVCDGVNDWVSVTSATTLDATSTGLSAGAWIYVSATGEQVILDKRGDGSTGCDSGVVSGGWELRVEGGAYPLNVKVIIKRNVNCQSGIEQSVTATSQVSQNTWTHVAFTFNNATDTVIIYVNGSNVASSSSITYDPSVSPGVKALGICDGNAYGATPPTATKMTGRLDDVFVAQAVYSAGQVQVLASKRKGAPLLMQVSGLTLYFPFEDCPDAAACPATTVDRSGNGNTGTYNGSPVGVGSILSAAP